MLQMKKQMEIQQQQSVSLDRASRQINEVNIHLFSSACVNLLYYLFIFIYKFDFLKFFLFLFATRSGEIRSSCDEDQSAEGGARGAEGED